jgi:hypothetical protein
MSAFFCVCLIERCWQDDKIVSVYETFPDITLALMLMGQDLAIASTMPAGILSVCIVLFCFVVLKMLIS